VAAERERIGQFFALAAAPFSVSTGLRSHPRLARFAVVPIAIAGGILVVSIPSGWPRVVATLVLGGVVAAVAPYWLGYAAGARRPTDDERAAVAAALDGSVAVRLRVVDDTTWVGNATAAGVVPGHRYVFVAADLFDVLDEESCTAVVAHEVAHHARRHVLLRHALAVAAAGYVVALAEFVPFQLLPTVAVGAVPYLLVSAWIVRRTELVADRAAARTTSPAVVADTLTTLVDEGLILGQTTGLGQLLTEHPSVDVRLARLRAPEFDQSGGRRNHRE
jgi:Zn-dependent protease with chaperone function